MNLTEPPFFELKNFENEIRIFFIFRSRGDLKNNFHFVLPSDLFYFTS